MQTSIPRQMKLITIQDACEPFSFDYIYLFDTVIWQKYDKPKLPFVYYCHMRPIKMLYFFRFAIITF